MVGEGMAAGKKAQTGSAGWGPTGMTRGLEAGGWVGWVSGSPWVYQVLGLRRPPFPGLCSSRVLPSAGVCEYYTHGVRLDPTPELP